MDLCTTLLSAAGLKPSVGPDTQQQKYFNLFFYHKSVGLKSMPFLPHHSIEKETLLDIPFAREKKFQHIAVLQHWDFASVEQLCFYCGDMDKWTGSCLN